MYLMILSRIIEAIVAGKKRMLLLCCGESISSRTRSLKVLIWLKICALVPRSGYFSGPPEAGRVELTEVDLLGIQLAGTGSGVLQILQTSAERP